MLYRELYEAGRISHWNEPVREGGRYCKPTPWMWEMDLHDFSRAMAFSAINVAIEEVRYCTYRGEILHHYIC